MGLHEVLPHHSFTATENTQQKEEETTIGRLLVLSGITGVGKTTISSEFLKQHPDWKRVITVTTRTPRPGEIEGIDYQFMTLEEFDAAKSRGEFVEETEVADDQGIRKCYGTLKTSIDEVFHGVNLVWVCDVLRAGELETVFNKYDSTQKELLKARTLSVILSSQSLFNIRNRFLNRDNNRTNPKAREAFMSRLREDWKHLTNPAQSYPNCITNDETVIQTIRELEILITKTLH